MKVKVEHVDVSYDKQIILENLSLSIQEGEFVSILGPSGCGKSTLLKILAGVLKKEKGTIFVDEQEIHGISGHFAYMPQDDLLLPWKNILDNVCLYGKIHKHKDEARQKALQNFEKFGLQGYEQSYPSALSGGMRQRAAFLRTALCHADVLLLDEPFGALDVITRNEMQDWLQTMRTSLNKTTLLVTHDIDEALFLSDRILILGKQPAHVIKEVHVSHENRTREWLYEQSALRTEIYHVLKGEAHV